MNYPYCSPVQPMYDSYNYSSSFGYGNMMQGMPIPQMYPSPPMPNFYQSNSSSYYSNEPDIIYSEATFNSILPPHKASEYLVYQFPADFSAASHQNIVQLINRIEANERNQLNYANDYSYHNNYAPIKYPNANNNLDFAYQVNKENYLTPARYPDYKAQRRPVEEPTYKVIKEVKNEHKLEHMDVQHTKLDNSKTKADDLAKLTLLSKLIDKNIDDKKLNTTQATVQRDFNLKPISKPQYEIVKQVDISSQPTSSYVNINYSNENNYSTKSIGDDLSKLALLGRAIDNTLENKNYNTSLIQQDYNLTSSSNQQYQTINRADNLNDYSSIIQSNNSSYTSNAKQDDLSKLALLGNLIDKTIDNKNNNRYNDNSTSQIISSSTNLDYNQSHGYSNYGYQNNSNNFQSTISSISTYPSLDSTYESINFSK